MWLELERTILAGMALSSITAKWSVPGVCYCARLRRTHLPPSVTQLFLIEKRFGAVDPRSPLEFPRQQPIASRAQNGISTEGLSKDHPSTLCESTKQTKGGSARREKDVFVKAAQRAKWIESGTSHLF